MAEKRKLDFFDIFVFDRDEEADALPAEPQEEHVPLIDLTVDSDEDDASNSAVIQRKQPQRTRRLPKRTPPGQLREPAADSEDEDVDFTVDSDENGASNSTAVLIQQDHPQSSSRQPRRTQTGQLQESATDSEEEQDEDEDSSEDEASSSSKRQSVKTGARSRRRRGNVNSLEIITFSQLEQKEKKGAQRVLDFYRDERQQALVHICSRFMSGKCRYMSKRSQHLSRHMKSRHPNEKHPGYKITQYPGFKDLKANDFVTKPYSELKKTDPQLAEEILALYKRPQNKLKQNVHLCDHFVRGKCQYYYEEQEEQSGRSSLEVLL